MKLKADAACQTDGSRSVIGVSEQEQAHPDYVWLTGAEAVLQPYMGTYFKTGIQPTALQAYRPVYQNVNGKQLYYRASWGIWLLSDGGVHESDIWMGRAYAKDDVECPTNARGWIVWDGTSWNTTYTLQVTETDGIEEEGSEAARPLQLLHVKQPPPPQHLSLREAEEALGLPKARELVAPLKQDGLRVSSWHARQNGGWETKILHVDHRNNFLSLTEPEGSEKQEWRLQQVMAVLDGTGALSLASLLGISMPELTEESSQIIALHGFWEGAAKKENILALHCDSDSELPARMRAAVSLAPHPGAAIRAAAKVLQAQQRFRAMRQDLRQRRARLGRGGSRSIAGFQAALGELRYSGQKGVQACGFQYRSTAATTKHPNLHSRQEEEVETHLADIPVKFKPDKALVIAEKIAVQVSEDDLHVLDKEILTLEIKDILRLFRHFSALPVKGDRAKLFLTDAPLSRSMLEGEDRALPALREALQQASADWLSVASSLGHRLDLEMDYHSLKERANRLVMREAPRGRAFQDDTSSEKPHPEKAAAVGPQGLQLADFSLCMGPGDGCEWPRVVSTFTGDMPVFGDEDDAEPALVGKWFYAPDGCFEIFLENGALVFDENVEPGEFEGEVTCDGVAQGEIRLCWVGEQLKASFRESPGQAWNQADLSWASVKDLIRFWSGGTKHRSSPRNLIVPCEGSSRRESTAGTSGRGPLGLDLQGRMRSNPEAAKSEARKDAPGTEGEAEIRSAFERFDKDSSGQIDIAELRSLCASLGRHLSDAEAQEALAALDANKSGTVSLDEFRTWWLAWPR
ncbi:Calmodulin [Symbiodinium microadriaticum]|uniref:Calmodulin n=1 Tax=Symbiodinium microadriaticum TaxID=2951 RepID=A0A1Q9CTM7_SYMMI|nr:Calmodulin [Symbiodinium microadriaticum]